VAAGLLAEAVLMQGEPGRAAAVLPETAPLRPFLRLLDGQELDPAERTSLPVVAWTAEGLHRPETSGLAAAAVLAQTGDLAAALAAAGPDGAEGLIRVHHLAVVGWCELARGRVEAAEQCAADLRALGRSEDWPYPYGLGALLGGLCALAAGRARRAALLLSESTVSGPAYARSYGLTQLALAYARAGDGEAADRASFDADRIVSARTPRLLADLADLTRAEVLLARGRHGGALRTATAVVERCEGTGRVLATVEALHLLARLDHSAATAARLAAAAAGLPAAAGLSAAAGFSAAAGLSAAAGPAAADAGGGEAVAADGLGTAAALDVRVRHARALADGDGEALAQVATEYDATGRHWLAGETAAASLALAGPGSRASWATTDRRILERAGTQADVELPAQWRGGDRFAPLTQREREITELAAGGWSSPRIAAQLHLSRRTVENHLQHSYRKLGVGRREELAAALGRSAATG
jgi:DNA-binding CsgD family transcriptional regulator